MPQFRTAAVAAVATTLLLAPTAAYAHPKDGHGLTGERSTSRSWLAYDRSSGSLRDLDEEVTSALDGASASVRLIGLRSSFLSLHVEDVDPSAAGKRFGAHLHTGPCITANSAAAGPHYNVQTLAGVVPPEISEETEVWLDFDVDSDGEGRSRTTVPFVPTAGERSIVIHAQPTMDSGAGVGTAGARIACLPLSID